MKINAREKILIGILGVILICGLYYNYFLTGQLEEISILRADKDTKLARKADIDSKIQNGATLDQDYISTKNSIINLSNKFFSEVDQEEFIMLLNTVATGSKVNVTQISFSESTGDEAIASFQEGRDKLDKYTELIARDKIKGYVKLDNKVTPGQDNKTTPDNPSSTPSTNVSTAVNDGNSDKVTNKAPATGGGSYANENTEGTDGNQPPEATQPTEGSETPAGEQAEPVNPNRTPEGVLRSEDPSAVTYANNIKTLVADVTLEGTYAQIHDFVSAIAENERNIIVESIQISKTGDGQSDKIKNSATMKIVFYKVIELEDYFAKKDSVLVKAVVTKSKKASPFINYSWSFKPVSTTSNVAVNALGNQITLPQPTQSVIAPYTVYPSSMQMTTPTQNNMPENLGPGNLSSTGNSATYTPFGGYVYNNSGSTSTPTPSQNGSGSTENNNALLTPGNVVQLNTLSGAKLVLDSGGATNKGDLSMADDGGLSRKVMKLDYHLGDIGYYGAIRVDIQDKKIVLNNKATDLMLKVKSSIASGHNIGVEIIDANNMVHQVTLFEDIDWTDWKDVRVLNLPRMTYPATIKSIYVSRVEDVKVTDAVIYIDSIAYNYK